MNWTMPTEFPDLSTARGIAVDIETRDDSLKQMGPGVRRGGYIVGIAVVTSDKEFRAYYPIAHDDGPNLNKSRVLAWLRDELKRDQPKIGANLLYDFDYLTHAGVIIGGDRWLDVQNAEPLIDENAGSYSLDTLAKKYLDRSKLTSSLESECKERGFKGKAASNIWQLPASVVGPYAIEDAELSIDILMKQIPILHENGLYELFKAETYLMPLLLHMRRIGVRLDIEKLEQTIKAYKIKLRKLKVQLNKLAGFDVQCWASSSLLLAFENNSLDYPLTAKTKKPSFTKDFLAKHEHPLPKLIHEVRSIDKFISTFLEGQMQNYQVDGRIHSLFNQLRSTEYGTVTGRFSSSHPNLQFIPKRDNELGPLCRSMFIPEEDCLWGQADYSQIEYRIFAHFAMGPGADEFRKQYNETPEIDYHQWCADVAGIERRLAKNINFGIIYGMGLKLLAKQLSLPIDEARDFLEQYNQKVPFLRTTTRRCGSVAENRGFVRTILGRRRRFDKFEPADRKLSGLVSQNKNQAVLRKEIRAFIQSNPTKDYSSGIQRAGTFKALNAVVQGSAADMLKVAMVNCWREGIFKTLVPHLTVHDELDVSIPQTPEGHEAWNELILIMQEAIPLKVPVLVDATTGSSWGKQDE